MTIEATDIKLGTTYLSETLYFTGGLFAEPQHGGGLALGPVDANDQDGLIFYLMTWPEVLETTRVAGCAFVGVNQSYDDPSPGRKEIWRPVVPSSSQRLHASDTWGAISHQASSAGDQRFSDVARYLSVSSYAAGLRLRDIARAHNEQLRWALLAQKKPGSRFSNMALTDIYLAFHALASELCSARDHLAHIAAIGCGAKEAIDSMAYLERWLSKPVHADHLTHPLVALLMLQMGTKETPGWLRVLGDIRNTMLHRQPMGADPANGALQLSLRPTRKGPLYTLRLVPMDAETPAGPDPFDQLLWLYNRFEALAIQASLLVPFKADLPLVVGK